MSAFRARQALRLALPLAGLFFFFSAAAAAAEEQSLFGVELKVWRPKLSAEVKGSTDAVEGATIDLHDDLDLDNSASAPYLKLTLGGSQRLALSATRLEFDGKARPDADFTFDGKTYTTAFEVDTELKADIYRAAWEADWISGLDLGVATVTLGTILGVDLFDASVSIKSDDPLVGRQEKDVLAPVPVVGLQGSAELPFGLGVYGEVAGMYARTGGFEGSLLEAEGGVRYHIWNFFAEAGWRQINFKVERDDDKADLRLGGPIVSLGFRF